MAVLGYYMVFPPFLDTPEYLCVQTWQVCAGLSLWWPEASSELQRDGGLDMSVKGELVQKDN